MDPTRRPRPSLVTAALASGFYLSGFEPEIIIVDAPGGPATDAAEAARTFEHSLEEKYGLGVGSIVLAAERCALPLPPHTFGGAPTYDPPERCSSRHLPHVGHKQQLKALARRRAALSKNVSR